MPDKAEPEQMENEEMTDYLPGSTCGLSLRQFHIHHAFSATVNHTERNNMGYKTLDSVGPLANSPNPTMEHALVMQTQDPQAQMNPGSPPPTVTFLPEENMMKNAVAYLRKDRSSGL